MAKGQITKLLSFINIALLIAYFGLVKRCSISDTNTNSIIKEQIKAEFNIKKDTTGKIVPILVSL